MTINTYITIAVAVCSGFFTEALYLAIATDFYSHVVIICLGLGVGLGLELVMRAAVMRAKMTQSVIPSVFPSVLLALTNAPISKHHAKHHESTRSSQASLFHETSCLCE